MPMSEHDRQFGGKPGSAAAAAGSMKEQYGDDWKRFFYGHVNNVKAGRRKALKRLRRK